MKTIPTVEGKMYCVSATTECTITSQSGTVLGTASPGTPFWFQAQKGETTTLSDDAAEYSASRFNAAPQQQLAMIGVLGGNAGSLPAGYKRVAWLESFSEAGNSQWVTVFYDLNRITCISADAEETQTAKASTVYSSTFFTHLKNVNHWRFDIKGYLNKINVTPARAESKLFTKENRAILNGVEYALEAGSRTGNYDNLHFLGQGYEDTRYHGGIRLFSASVQGAEGLVFNLIPALDETGAPCLFDTVNKQPYYNRGTGDFAYPAESSTYSLRRMVPDLCKLTENGLRRLYHSPAGYQGELYDYALENGYKPIVEEPAPENGYWSPRWRETEDEIVLEWVETDPPRDEFGMPEETLTKTE